MNNDQIPDWLQNPYSAPNTKLSEPDDAVTPQRPNADAPNPDPHPSSLSLHPSGTTAHSRQPAAHTAPEPCLLQTTTDLQVLPQYASEHCEYADLVGKNAEEIVIQRLTGNQSEEQRAHMRDYLRTMEIEILARGSSAMEVLLARRIVFCYASLQYFETLYLQSMSTPRRPKEHAVELLRLNQASDRYLAALRALAIVRKLKISHHDNISLDKILDSTCVLPQNQDQAS